jgi:hypothetical protein
MAWHDYLAVILFSAAAVFVALRAYRALFGRAKAGCGSGCGSCSSSDPVASRPANLLSIGSAPSEQRTRD